MRKAFGYRPRVPILVASLVLTLALLWPAVVNRGAFLFADTTAYVRGADGAVLKLTGHRSLWSDQLLEHTPTTPNAATPATASVPGGAYVPVADRIVLSGRSIYYGGLLYLTLLARSFWPLVLLQAAILAAVMVMTVDRFAPGRGGGIALLPLAALIAIAALTQVGFYAAFAMPDVFAAVAVLASAHVALAWRRDTAGRRLFWITLLTAGALFHSATLLILIALAAAMAMLRWRRPTAWVDGRLWPLVLAILLAAGGEALFSAGVRHATGNSPLRPPFLTARLIEDGPGMAYLRSHCGQPGAPYVCRYRDRLPMPSDGFLWSLDPRTGVFKGSGPDDQRALAADDSSFVRRVVLAEPGAVLLASLRNAGSQAITAGLGEFNYDPSMRAFLSDRVPEPERSAVQATAAYRNRMPTAMVTALTLPLALASVAAIGFVAVRTPRMRGLACAGWLVGAVLLNDAICGAFSGPHDRYGARMIWLLPLAATIALVSWRTEREERGA